MRRVPTLPRRLLALGAAVFIGAAGAVAFSAPASATSGTLTAKVECKEDKAQVTWTLKNNDAVTAKLTSVSRTVTGGIQKDATLSANGTLTATETVEVDKGKVELVVGLHFANGHKTKASEDATVAFACVADFESKCDGTVVVKLKNPIRHELTFRVSGAGGFKQDVEVAANGTATVTVPADKASEITVAVVLGKDKEIVVAKGKWVKPEKCGVPTLTHESTCDKLIIKVTNPADGRPVQATIKVGDQTDTETVEPGETAVAEIEEPEDGLVATVTVGDKVTEVKYVKPNNCGGLPVTGVNASVTAGVALVLVTGGLGLFFAFRRRRIRFAA